MNKIRSQFKITKPASIAAALLALVLSFAGTTLARNTQTSDSGTPPTTYSQVSFVGPYLIRETQHPTTWRRRGMDLSYFAASLIPR